MNRNSRRIKAAVMRAIREINMDRRKDGQLPLEATKIKKMEEILKDLERDQSVQSVLKVLVKLMEVLSD